ncbi:kinase-like domain-containing protein [Microdochium bolleyi]|uniref:EKC/KEOPS complex subunit BUD32 n=1 Tax=Microdochium bolleyi TaxID=196109 RepID=A0A136J156_9PEZI|nr:kinase-like domain-containing protein [Microdochium bolleyi]
MAAITESQVTPLAPPQPGTAPKEPAFPLPRLLTLPSSTAPELITQGAEGRLYKSTYLLPSLPCALKHRPSKPWRHPVLDARLTRHRILSEARILIKCRREGVPVPAVYAVEISDELSAASWIEGEPVRKPINEWLRRRRESERQAGRAGDAPVSGDLPEDADLVDVMRRIGSAVGRLHRVGIIHGDLTTSNMMLRHSRLPIVIIDFGLAAQGSADEDRAVDLYVLERAFASTHPRAESLFRVVLEAYGKEFKTAGVVLRKLEDVRMRGRKRSMLG